MYSGTTLRYDKGRIIGVHQRLDRIALKRLKRYIPTSVNFPKIETILRFEGLNGPDGIKRKSPGVDEPWHFMNPNDKNDRRILIHIENHSFNLSKALRENDEIQAAFEAAWLAHVVIDGMTPPHHYPIESKIEELWGKPYNERGSVKDKSFIHGEGKIDTLLKNWEYWGTKGVMMTHFNFEIGAASAIATERFKDFSLNERDFEQLKRDGFEKMYLEVVDGVAAKNMYGRLYKKGWTESLAREIREDLAPQMIRMVALAWYDAIQKSIKGGGDVA